MLADTEKDNAQNMTPSHFAALVLAIAATQDKAAFIQLFNHFAPRVKSFLMKGGAAPDLADELAQETMLTVWDKAASYDSKQAAVSTWIFTIARNKRIDARRKVKGPQMDLIDNLIEDPQAESPYQAAFESEQSEALDAALAALPEEQAALIRKAYFEEKTHKDIANENHIPLGTVKSRLRLALDKLRHHLGGIANKEGGTL